MATDSPTDTDDPDDLPTLEAPVSEVLSALTGRPPSEFQPPEGVEYPHPEDLESVIEEE